MDVLNSTAVELARAVAAGEVGAREVAVAYLDRIEKLDPKIHAFLHVNREWSLAFADKVDRKRVDSA